MGCCIRHGAASSPLPSLLQLSTLAALLFATASSASATATVSISQDGGYLNLRRCAKQCLWGTDDLLVAGLECSEPWANDCLCQTDDAAQATSFLSACCSSRCTIGGADHDITSAINEYDAYCQRNSFTVGDGDVDTALVVTSAVSISADDAYARLPDCAKACVWGDVDDLMAKGLECSDPWVNACLCREDLAGVVDAFLSQCASAKCSAAGVDTNVASARSVYENYCSRNNYDVGGGAASTPPGSQPTGDHATTGQGTDAQATETGGSKPDSGGGGSGTGGSKLSTPALIGIIVSVTCSVLGLIFGVGFKIWQHKKEQKEKKLTEMQRADAQLGVQYEQDPYVPKK